MKSVAQQWLMLGLCTAAGRPAGQAQDWAAPAGAELVLMNSWSRQALSRSGAMTTSLTPQPGALLLRS